MAVSYKDYYKLLGVEREAKAEEISKAYKSWPANTIGSQSGR